MSDFDEQVEKEVQRHLLIYGVIIRRELPDSPSKDTLLEYIENRAVPKPNDPLSNLEGRDGG